MTMKPIIIFLLLLCSVAVGCGDDTDQDTCKPRGLTFCFDKHHIWTCAPDGDPADNPPYTEQKIDCRSLNDGQTPYCGTHLDADGNPESTECLDELIWPFGEA